MSITWDDFEKIEKRMKEIVDADLPERLARRLALKGTIARLTAEASGRAIVFPEDVAAGPVLVIDPMLATGGSAAKRTHRARTTGRKTSGRNTVPIKVSKLRRVNVFSSIDVNMPWSSFLKNFVA